MEPERWRRIDALFQAAADLSPDDAAAFLDSVCDGDEELRREVEQLLDADRQGGGFIETHAVAAAAELLAEAVDGVAEGTLVSHYRILARIGSGGMGDVYRAEDTLAGRVVAIKLLPSWLNADPQLRGRFLREARLASALQHPNVCRIHDVGRSGDQLFIAMQYVDGATLKQLVASGPLDVDLLLAIAVQTADGIAAAHREGIAHRDVKSSNIVVTRDGQAVVLDFGLAKLMDEGVRDSMSVFTRPGTVLGTPAYMSPEQARGESVDHRSDIFSLGIVIYEMATGRLPFERKSQADTLTAVCLEPHEPLTAARSDLPEALSAVVDRALAKEPADRYQSMEALLDDLRGIALRWSA